MLYVKGYAFLIRLPRILPSSNQRVPQRRARREVRIAVLAFVVFCSAASGSRQDLQAYPATAAPSASQSAHESRGVKSAIVKAMTKVLAKAIREGGEYASWVVGKLDASAAKAFRKHSKRIGEELDSIAEIPDLTTRIVKEKLYYFLNGTLGLSGGTSLVIAQAVKAVLDFLVF